MAPTAPARPPARPPAAQDLSTPAGRRTAWTDSLFVDHALLRLSWRNWGVVEPGRLYRSNHPTPGQLEAAARDLGLRAVVNLRGHRPGCGSDALARAAAARLGLTQLDAPLESRGAPHRDRVLRLAGLFDALEGPTLLHCKSGADRTGLAAGIWLLARGRGVAAARAQLTWRHGHVAASRTGILDAFFDLYAARLARGPIDFLDWVAREYDEAGLRRDFAAGRAAGAGPGRARAWADLLVDRVLRRE